MTETEPKTSTEEITDAHELPVESNEQEQANVSVEEETEAIEVAEAEVAEVETEAIEIAKAEAEEEAIEVAEVESKEEAEAKADEPTKTDKTEPKITLVASPEQPLAFEHTFPDGQLDFDAVKVVTRLERFGHVAYFVGGCIRDLLLGVRPKDYDLVTSATPKQVKKLFRNSRIIGRRFKLVHVVFGGKVIELSTFRGSTDNDVDEDSTETDIQTNSENTNDLIDQIDSQEKTTDNLNSENPDSSEEHNDKPEDDKDKSLLIKSDNDFGTAQEDSVRRDFTVNGLYYSLSRKEIIDYVGGIVDLKARKLATIGDPETRFREDPVRMLRAIKLMVKLNLNVDNEVTDKIKEFHEKLLDSSTPRILEEMYKLLDCGVSSDIFNKMQEYGIFETILKPFHTFFSKNPDKQELSIKLLSELDSVMDDNQTPAKELCLATLLLPVTKTVFDETDNEQQIELSKEDIYEFLKGTHGLQSVSRKDRENAFTLLEDLKLIKESSDEDLKGFIRKRSFANTYRLFKIASQVTGLFTEEMEKLQEMAKDYNFNPPPRQYYRKHNNNKYKNRKHYKGRSR